LDNMEFISAALFFRVISLYIISIVSSGHWYLKIPRLMVGLHWYLTIR
jgi:hypothetical protein